MALTDINTLKTSLQSGIAETFVSSQLSLAGGRTSSLYRLIIAPGQVASPAIPTTAVSLDNTGTGAINRLIPSYSPSNVYATEFRVFNSGTENSYWVIDRLCHMGGLSGTVTTAQTVNTAALTRHTSGLGVYAGAEIYVGIGSTTTTITMTYTNSDGVGSRVSPGMSFGGAGFGAGTGAQHRFIIFPLQAGDKGVQSVQSVTLAATTGAIGNFGITLFKPLSVFSSPQVADTPINILSGGIINIPQIDPTACISLLMAPNTASTNSAAFGSIQLGID